MSNLKKPLFGFALLLVVLALAPSIAQAAPHWYRSGVKIGATKERLDSYFRNFTLNNKTEKFTVVCEVRDEGKMWNPVGGGNGQDEIAFFEAVNCKATGQGSSCTVTVKAVVSGTSPWATELEEEFGIIRDKIVGFKIEVTLGNKCNILPGTTDTYTGELKPRMVNGTTGGEEGCEKGDSFGEFDEKSGLLKSTKGATANIEGNDCIWGESATPITVANP
jgi:hypothetical protein